MRRVQHYVSGTQRVEVYAMLNLKVEKGWHTEDKVLHQARKSIAQKEKRMLGAADGAYNIIRTSENMISTGGLSHCMLDVGTTAQPEF